MTTEDPVLSTALVMKDFFEYKLISLISGLFNGWDMTFAGYLMLTVINKAISNSFWMSLFNFSFYVLREI